MIVIRWASVPNQKLNVSVERRVDQLFHDWSSSGWTDDPEQLYIALPAKPTIGRHTMSGRYELVIRSTPVDIWPDGDYIIGIHMEEFENMAQTFFYVTMKDGDEVSVTVLPNQIKVGIVGTLE